MLHYLHFYASVYRCEGDWCVVVTRPLITDTDVNTRANERRAVFDEAVNFLRGTGSDVVNNGYAPFD